MDEKIENIIHENTELIELLHLRQKELERLLKENARQQRHQLMKDLDRLETPR